MSIQADTFEDIAQAVSKLIQAYRSGERTIVSTPVMFPSGAFAGVSVFGADHRCIVSDFALGAGEADLHGASDFYDASARDAAKWFGIEYDGANLLARDVDISQVAGAVVAVANASAAAASRAATRAAEARDKSKNAEIFAILKDIFGGQHVNTKSDIKGRDAVWEAHNVVTLHGKKAVFEYVSKSQVSIASKFMMFSDLVRLDEPPTLNAVVANTDDIGSKGAMLSDVSNVIELGADHGIYKKYAGIR